MSFATLEQIISNKNSAEDYINDNASITFFKNTYRQYKDFAKINNEYILQNCKFGDVCNFTLPKTDYINNMTLSIFLPAIKCKYRKWTKGQLQEKLKEFGYNWYVDKNDINKTLTDEDFDLLVGGKILKNDDGYYREHEEDGIINNLVKDLLSKKEYYESILKQLNQSIKDILKNITLDDIRNIFNLTFPCDNFTDLIINTDYKVKDEVFNLYNELSKKLINDYIEFDYGYFDDNVIFNISDNEIKINEYNIIKLVDNYSIMYDNNNIIAIQFIYNDLNYFVCLNENKDSLIIKHYNPNRIYNVLYPNNNYNENITINSLSNKYFKSIDYLYFIYNNKNNYESFNNYLIDYVKSYNEDDNAINKITTQQTIREIYNNYNNKYFYDIKQLEFNYDCNNYNNIPNDYNAYTNLNDLLYTTFNTIIENTFNMENGYINKDDILDLINNYMFDKSLYDFINFEINAYKDFYDKINIDYKIDEINYKDDIIKFIFYKDNDYIIIDNNNLKFKDENILFDIILSNLNDYLDEEINNTTNQDNYIILNTYKFNINQSNQLINLLQYIDNITNTYYQLKLKLIVLKCILELMKVYINNDNHRIIKTLDYLYNNSEYYKESLVKIYEQFINILYYNYQNTNYYLFNYVNFTKYYITKYISDTNKDKLNELLELVSENMTEEDINYINDCLNDNKKILNITNFNNIKNNIINNLFINEINEDKYIYDLMNNIIINEEILFDKYNKNNIKIFNIDCTKVNDKVSEIMSEEYFNVFRDTILNDNDDQIISIFDKIKQIFSVLNPGENNIELLLNYIYSYINSQDKYEYFITLISYLFDIYNKDDLKNWNLIMKYLMAFINDENEISKYNYNEEINNIKSYVNIFDKVLEKENGDYIHSNQYALYNTLSNENDIYNGQLSYYNDYLINKNNDEINFIKPIDYSNYNLSLNNQHYKDLINRYLLDENKIKKIDGFYSSYDYYNFYEINEFMIYNNSNIRNLILNSNNNVNTIQTNNKINSIELIPQINNEIINYYYNIESYFVMPVLIINDNNTYLSNDDLNNKLKQIGIKLYIFYLTIFDDFDIENSTLSKSFNIIYNKCNNQNEIIETKLYNFNYKLLNDSSIECDIKQYNYDKLIYYDYENKIVNYNCDNICFIKSFENYTILKDKTNDNKYFFRCQINNDNNIDFNYNNFIINDNNYTLPDINLENIKNTEDTIKIIQLYKNNNEYVLTTNILDILNHILFVYDNKIYKYEFIIPKGKNLYLYKLNYDNNEIINDKTIIKKLFNNELIDINNYNKLFFIFITDIILKDLDSDSQNEYNDRIGYYTNENNYNDISEDLFIYYETKNVIYKNNIITTDNNNAIIYLLKESKNVINIRFNIIPKKYVENNNNVNTFYNLNIESSSDKTIFYNENTYIFNCISFFNNNYIINSYFEDNIITSYYNNNNNKYLLYTILFQIINNNNNEKKIIYLIPDDNTIYNNIYYTSSNNQKYFYIYKKQIYNESYNYYYYPIYDDESFNIYELDNNEYYTYDDIKFYYFYVNEEKHNIDINNENIKTFTNKSIEYNNEFPDLLEINKNFLLYKFENGDDYGHILLSYKDKNNNIKVFNNKIINGSIDDIITLNIYPYIPNRINKEHTNIEKLHLLEDNYNLIYYDNIYVDFNENNNFYLLSDYNKLIVLSSSGYFLINSKDIDKNTEEDLKSAIINNMKLYNINGLQPNINLISNEYHIFNHRYIMKYKPLIYVNEIIIGIFNIDIIDNNDDKYLSQYIPYDNNILTTLSSKIFYKFDENKNLEKSSYVSESNNGSYILKYVQLEDNYENVYIQLNNYYYEIDLIEDLDLYLASNFDHIIKHFYFDKDKNKFVLKELKELDEIYDFIFIINQFDTNNNCSLYNWKISNNNELDEGEWIKINKPYDVCYINDNYILHLNKDNLLENPIDNNFTLSKLSNEQEILYNDKIDDNDNNNIKIIDNINENDKTYDLLNKVYLYNKSNILQYINNNLLNVLCNNTLYKQLYINNILNIQIYDYVKGLNIIDYIKNIYKTLTNKEYDTTTNFYKYIESNYNYIYDSYDNLLSYCQNINNNYYDYFTTEYMTNCYIFNKIINNMDNYFFNYYINLLNNREIIHYVNNTTNSYEPIIRYIDNVYNDNDINDIYYSVNKLYINSNLTNTSTIQYISKYRSQLYNDIINNYYIDKQFKELLNTLSTYNYKYIYEGEEYNIDVNNINFIYDLIYSNFMFNICHDDINNTYNNKILKYDFNDGNNYYIITNFINYLIDIINKINNNPNIELDEILNTILDSREKDVILFIPNCLFNILYKYKFVSGDIYPNEFKTKINNENIEYEDMEKIIINIYMLILNQLKDKLEKVEFPIDKKAVKSNENEYIYNIIQNHMKLYNYSYISYTDENYKDITLSSSKEAILINKNLIEYLIESSILEIKRLLDLIYISSNHILIDNNEFNNYLNLYKNYMLCNEFSNIINYVKDNNIEPRYYSTHQVINDKINELITVNNTLLINDIFYQFYKVEIIENEEHIVPSFELYDYLFVINNYIINNFHQYYNKLFGYLLYNLSNNKFDYFKGNVIKECIDYIINCPKISNINPDRSSYIDFFGNSNYIYNYCIPYVNIILNDFINSYKNYYLYKDIFNYLLEVFETNIYQPIDYIYINIIKYIYEDIIINNNSTLINKDLFKSYLTLNINENNCTYDIFFDYEDDYIKITKEQSTDYNFYYKYNNTSIANEQKSILKVFILYKIYYELLQPLNNKILPILSDLYYDNNYLSIFDIFNYNQGMRKKRIESYLNDEQIDNNMHNYIEVFTDLLIKEEDYYKNIDNNNTNEIKSLINYCIDEYETHITDQDILNIINTYKYNINQLNTIKNIADYIILNDDEILKELNKKLTIIINNYYNDNNQLIKSCFDYLITQYKNIPIIYENLYNWYNEYKDILSINNINKMLDKIYDLNDDKQSEYITPEILYNKFYDIINTQFNNFKYESDFIRFLIYYLINNSEFKILINIYNKSNSNIELYNNIFDYYYRLYLNTLDKIDKIGYLEDNIYDLDNYSECEDFIRELWKKHNQNYIECCWIKEIGHYLIDKIDFYIGDQLIDTLTGDLLHIYYKLFMNKELKKGYDKLIGNVKEINNYDNNIKNSYQLFIPLQFFFNRYIQCSIPMLSLIHSDAKVRITFNNMDKLILYNKEEGDIIFNNKHNDLYNGLMIVDNIIIKMDEKIKISQEIKRMLIDQHQYYYTTINLNQYNNKKIQISNEFYNSCKEFYLLIRLINEKQKNNYKINNENILERFDIRYNQQLRQPNEDIGIKMYSLLNKDLKHSRINDDGIYCYSFSLYPQDLQPSGTSNMSKVGELELDLYFNWEEINKLDKNDRKVEIIWICKNINFLNFVSGQGGLLYMNTEL